MEANKEIETVKDAVILKNSSDERPSHQEVSTPTELKDKYRYIERLGAGSQAQVFKAVRLSDGEEVAIKQLNIDSVQNWKEYDLFWREAEVLKSLDMDGIATFYETIECLDTERPHAFIVQKCIQGKSLAEMMKMGYRFSFERIFEIGIQLIDLLEKLHTHEPPVIHRDIKPSNIMFEPLVGDEFKLYLIDFGAVANPQVQKGGSTVAGTYGYMPPEQLMGRPKPASDVYSMAATLVYMLCGVEPIDMQIADHRPVIEPHLEHLPHAIVSCLRKMLIPNENERLHDYKMIRVLFTNFINNDYSDEIHDEIDVVQYEKELLNVKRFGQPGNAELWLHLEEKVPRKIPLCYQKIAVNGFTDGVAGRMIAKGRAHQKIVKLQSMLNVLGILIISLIFLGICVAISLFLSIMALAASFAFILFFLMVILRFYKNQFAMAITIMLYRRVLVKEPDPVIQSLLRKGRKTMATITEIKYCQADTDLVDIGRVDPAGVFYKKAPSEVLDPHCLVFYNHIPVSYTIYYKFNPPDDSSPDDLVHHVTVHYNPEKTLRVGDAIPILYSVNSASNREVTSMPFPFPLGKIVNKAEMHCRSYDDKH